MAKFKEVSACPPPEVTLNAEALTQEATFLAIGQALEVYEKRLVSKARKKR